ncbi:winged helix-turn-helix domain-containing protein [Kutzneria sp. NPDC051319]|uniref:winged helix-turn-helix domain-containing protein n=1 Tax=Kutzneria sp. NPDC051319 TaxID=3155047 RepID=UPI00342710EC
MTKSSDDPSDQDGLAPSRRVADRLRRAIERGDHDPGDRLPPYRELAASEGVAVGTIREAMRLLSAEGIVELRDRSGAYVLAPGPASTADHLRDLRAHLEGIQAQTAAAMHALDQVEQASRRASAIPRFRTD